MTKKHQSLGEKAKLSVIWNTGFNIFRDILQFLVMLVLVRLIEPEAYGQFGLVTSIMGFISVFAFQNFVAHTLQIRQEEKIDYQIHFTAGAVIQFSAFILTNIVAFFITYFDKYQELAIFLHIMSITFLLEWPCEIRRKMLEKALDWKQLRLLHGLGLIVSSVLAIIMGWLGAGVYALLLPGLLVTIPFIYNLFKTQKWRPTWDWEWQKYKPAVQFGLTRTASGITNNGKQLLESALIVQIMGYASAGLFGRAIGLANMFCQRFSIQLMYAMYPVLTKIDVGTEKYKHVSVLILRMVAWTTIPIAILFAVLAAPVIQLIYGTKWLEVIPLLPWAMLLAMFSAMVHVMYMLLLAHYGQTKCFKIDLFLLIGTSFSLFFLLPKGFENYLQGLIVTHLIVFFITFIWLKNADGIDMNGVIHALLPPFVAVSGTFILCELLINLFHITNNYWAAVIYGFLFLAFYMIIIRLLFPYRLKELINYMPAKHFLNQVFIFR